MDKCGYCEYMIPSGVDHYCKEELLEEITSLMKLLDEFYPTMSVGQPPLHLIKRFVENDDKWNERTKDYCENRYWR